ncbi:DUF6802 family protein [Rhodococcus coprophilus]|uniref:DUF6802 domain-containing protein n=1 Tax=Rhodococcus coprophilus TaxID=38310 RepID=A0A2X4U7G7_9NOCA|nr:DUF6802 family protein [Rhodococcus coprophilus]MBM7459336.1 hypothetical protein [Rhodococcus coprophilus]SQI35817.1 Uncharacterised protein [Rhodococcus coprophilus]
MMETFPGGDGSGTVVPDEFDPVAAAVWADEAVPTADLDGDGIFDTVVADSAVADRGIFASGGLVVATDTDLDGHTDRLTAIEDDGQYGVWELHRELDGTTRWTCVDQGNLEDVDHERNG